jgi:hypothetical protein
MPHCAIKRNNIRCHILAAGVCQQGDAALTWAYAANTTASTKARNHKTLTAQRSRVLRMLHPLQ